MPKRLKRWHKWTIFGVLAGVVLIAGFALVWRLTHSSERRASEDFADLAEQAAAATSTSTAGSTNDPPDTSTATTAAAPGTTASPGSTAAPAATAASSTSGALTGVWTAITPTEEERENFYVGYRVDEVLFGQNVTATGRTREVTGTLTFDDTSLTAAQFTAQMATVVSDESRRDNQFRGRIMDVDQFPTATFVLTAPVAVGTVPPDSEIVTVSVTGDLTLRGTTKPVTVEMQAFVAGNRITVTGEIPIVFEEWGIPEPSNRSASVEGDGVIEFLLTFTR
jgi:polyisoprenoid-binding protein YceI